ncbi:hypothetical protein [Ramlibacter humi]|nr:hypothetical protein [Ramlibacter humi]
MDITPAQATAEMHRKLAEPGSARRYHPEREEVHPVGRETEVKGRDQR